MPTVEDGGVIAERSENGVTTSIYPNPNNGQSVNFAVSGMEGEMHGRRFIEYHNRLWSDIGWRRIHGRDDPKR
jgi:hypothetical protein